MLQMPETRFAPGPTDFSDEARQGELFDLDRLLSAVRRQVWLILGCVIIGLSLGIAYIITAVPLYTATIDILIDKGRSKVIDELSGAGGVLQDEADILSQVELLRSEQLAQTVVSRIQLTENARFMMGNPSLTGYAFQGVQGLISAAVSALTSSVLSPEDAEAPAQRDMSRAIAILRRGIDVDRVGRTYVLNLAFTAASPDIAATVAQAYGDAYLDDQLQSKYEATRRASGWLQDRISELKQQSFDADLKVQQFRTDNNLISAGGQLVSEQQLSEINTQLVTAQAVTAEAKARLDQIEDLIDSGRTDAVVNDALVSSTINNLREDFLRASRLKTEIEQKLGPAHVQVLRLQAEMTELERLIFGELRRIAESYKSNYNVALSRQKSLEESLKAIVGVNAASNTTQVRLRELERESATFKSLYDNFLQRYQQTVQQQSFPISDARIITPASPPTKPSFPRKTLILALSLALGIASGLGMAFIREYRDRFFRIGDQIRDELRTEFLGFTPTVLPKVSAGSSVSVAAAEPGQSLWDRDDISLYVRSHPLSMFSETLRNAKVAADIGLAERPSKVIGVVSCLPGEGKTTVATNVAVMFAMQGAKVLLVDGDLRNPGLTRSLRVRPKTGLIEAILDGSQSDVPLLWDGSGRLAVLPTVLQRRVSHTSELLASVGMAKLLMKFRSDFDYTVVDLPPIGPVVDAKAFANRVDAFIFVVEWGRTSRQLVRSVMHNHPTFHAKCLGVILNKSDESKMKLYESLGSVEYYASRYQSYYQS